jgi:ABC-type nitrate/sulfonate/bicarbonate transport system substrate-binding protein
MTFRIQPHVRLQEWIAEEKGYFRHEGLDYEFEAAGFAGGAVTTTSTVTQADAAPLDARSGAFEDMESQRACDVSAACHWAVAAAASSSFGKMYARAYSVCPSGIFVAPDSDLTRPENLAGVKVGVGYHSGSHYSAIQGLEPFLDREQITLGFVGRPYDRVRLIMRREIPAANVFGAQYYLLEQLGFRKIVDTTFMMGFLLAADTDTGDVDKYFRGLRSAQQELDLEPETYKHYWLREMPEDLAEVVDVRRFGPGERIVFEPYTKQMFDRTHRWLDSWGLLSGTTPVRPEYATAMLG